MHLKVEKSLSLKVMVHYHRQKVTRQPHFHKRKKKLFGLASFLSGWRRRRRQRKKERKLLHYLSTFACSAICLWRLSGSFECVLDAVMSLELLISISQMLLIWQNFHTWFLKELHLQSPEGLYLFSFNIFLNSISNSIMFCLSTSKVISIFLLSKDNPWRRDRS